MIHSPSRRQVLQFAAGFGAAVAAPWSRAAGGPVVLGTWGGDTERLLMQMVKTVKDGNSIDVKLDVGTPAARKTKMLSQLNRPQNAMDITFLVDSDVYLMSQANALRPLDPALIPGYANLLEEFRKPHSLPTMYSALVLVYSDKVKAPTAIADLWRAEYKVGLADLSYDKVIPMAAVAHGGSTSNFAPGYDALMKLKQQGMRVYSSNEAVGNAFKSGEINAAIMWKGRAYQWMEAGLPVRYGMPKEGAYPVNFEMAVTRNSGFPREAHQVLGAALLPEIQRSMALGLGQVPTTKNAGMPPDVAAKVGFTDQERERFMKPDFAHNAAKASEMLDFWNQRFKG
ncbi:extracellular solute-binding protein [Ramlibacter henchirensis]|uniref:Extracellular solute-binding protein n=1 Tax=Ramlibacter henchirensis TaxID=204072 RepID=A0A4Z0BWY4_9BURK|nr:extracellular solute-binding protein [Ramlibacter henchirensis]TFZ02768.1 extracellular solute-binding protein [Ramlibacter henchirensis]